MYKHLLKYLLVGGSLVLMVFSSAALGDDLSNLPTLPATVETLENFSNSAKTRQLALPTKLLGVRVNLYRSNLRVVFDFSNNFHYSLKETGEALVIMVENATSTNDAMGFLEVDDPIITFLQVLPEGPNLKITLPLIYPIRYQAFKLGSPSRLVIDCGREFKKTVSSQKIQKGLELMTITLGTQSGLANAYALKIDPQYFHVFPALSGKKQKSFVESFTDFFVPWGKKSDKPFSLSTVSQIAKQNQASAAINGSFFANSAYPLGMLMINYELISYPIYDRTAFIVTEDNHFYIDNFIIKNSFQVEKGYVYDINNMNAPRPTEGITLYTPIFGEKTQTLANGFEIVVENNLIKNTALGNAVIPRQGYVISIAGSLAEHLAQTITQGEKIQVDQKLAPYNENILSPIKHLVGGGPRLIKKGHRYISKYAEKFKADIARGQKARSAIGITADQKIIFAVVEGAQKNNGQTTNKNHRQSVGANLEELSELMLYLKSEDAMNLDGGSSSALIVNQKLINRPSGITERAVNNAILIKKIN